MDGETGCMNNEIISLKEFKLAYNTDPINTLRKINQGRKNSSSDVSKNIYNMLEKKLREGNSIEEFYELISLKPEENIIRIINTFQSFRVEIDEAIGVYPFNSGMWNVANTIQTNINLKNNPLNNIELSELVLDKFFQIDKPLEIGNSINIPIEYESVEYSAKIIRKSNEKILFIWDSEFEGILKDLYPKPIHHQVKNAKYDYKLEFRLYINREHSRLTAKFDLINLYFVFEKDFIDEIEIPLVILKHFFRLDNFLQRKDMVKINLKNNNDKKTFYGFLRRDKHRYILKLDVKLFSLLKDKITNNLYHHDKVSRLVLTRDTNGAVYTWWFNILENDIEYQLGTIMETGKNLVIGTWIFQGNPTIFDIDNYVQNNKYIWWSLRQEHFVDKIQLNDEVYLWRSDGGKRGTGGILAKARVVGLPQERAGDRSAEDYWHTDDWQSPYLAVKLEILEVRLEEGFISRLSLLDHPVLKDLLIHRLRQQTNYLLHPEHAFELNEFWNVSNKNMQQKPKVSVPEDLQNIELGEIAETEKEQIIKSRIGQSAFKKALLAVEKKCRLCGVTDEHFLVASHIKPCSQSNNQERLDVDNGLLLCPNHDALFDKGYISFDENGKIMISDSLDDATKVFLNINEAMKIVLNERQKGYMKWHWVHIFKNCQDINI